jgi:SWI/SNF-related matrix-associated actin-dependent regulator of chromatin subfamily A protein 2/4
MKLMFPDVEPPHVETCASNPRSSTRISLVQHPAPQ